jgi:nitroimidazol reductase NimA-like FMN-containing flavoprotein (pyridoxamine 5'-phosphate oxidase superfamily)
MNEPVTELDARFSDPNAVATGWEETCPVLEAAELFWISTVRPDGPPHGTPLVAVWIAGAFHFCTGTAEQKSIDLRSNPHVLLTTGSNRWDRGLDDVVEGDAVRETDDAKLGRLAAAWTTKWDGRWQWTARDGAFHHDDHGVALLFSVAPIKILAFSPGKFSHTRHRF